ncbi:hypothetical protein ACNKHM_01485 [Shigella sonnei]
MVPTTWNASPPIPKGRLALMKRR